MPVLLWSLQAFLDHPDIAQVVIVLPAPAEAPVWLAPLVDRRVVLAVGGAERSDSVIQGTTALGSECITVLVHDAARPLIDRATIDAVIATARTGTGAVPGIPVGDTVKESHAGDGSRPRIVRTVPREALWRAQTPQGFPRAMLEAAQAQARTDRSQPTDDAAMVEHAGGTVRLVPGSDHNFKLTTEADFALAELILAARQSSAALKED